MTELSHPMTTLPPSGFLLKVLPEALLEGVSLFKILLGGLLRLFPFLIADWFVSRSRTFLSVSDGCHWATSFNSIMIRWDQRHLWDLLSTGSRHAPCDGLCNLLYSLFLRCF